MFFCRLVHLVFLVVAFGALAKEAALAKEQVRLALVIGNEAYTGSPVEGATSNAREVAAVLRAGGFDVVYAENARRTDITEAVRIFTEKMERGAVAIVYFDGHAVQYEGRNFLIAINSRISSQADIGTEAFDEDLLFDPLIVGRPSACVVIIDASNPNLWNLLLPARTQGLAAQEPLKGISVIYATAPGKVAATDIFSSELIKAIKTPGLGFDAVISRTRASILRATAKQQLVWQSSPPPKDLVILSGEAHAQILRKTPDALELGFWDTIKDSETAADFQIYLNSYPEGLFVAVARAHLAQLLAKTSGQTPQKPDEPSIQSTMPGTPGSAQQSVRDCPECPEIVLIPAGSVEMGSADGSVFERPVHHVEIRKAFYIGLREVTFAEWDACVNERGCQYSPADREQGRGLRPVTDVAWSDAKTYLSWLSSKTGRAYRLPTEAEWEYAERAGSNTVYPWGNTLEKDRANCLGCNTISFDKTVETGTFPANGFGLFDMAGNAAEWVQDCWNDTYSGAPTDGSAWDKPNCPERVLRGGSFNGDARFVRSSARFKYDYNVRYYANGFRVARD